MSVRKIVLVDINQFFGGGQVYGLQLAQMLVGDFDLTVICVNERFARELKQRGIRTIDLSSLLKLGRIVHQFLIIFLCVWLRMTGKADLFWLNGLPEIVVTPICRLLGCRVLVTRHLTLQFEPQSRVKLFFRILAEKGFKLCAPYATKIVCVAHAVRESMETILPPDKLAVIHNWVTKLPSQVEIGGQNPEVCKLLFVGRVQPHKGPFTIVEAMNLLRADPEAGKISLTVVGEGPARDELAAAAQGLDVTFTGFQKEPSVFYAASDVFINPSPGPEGLPLVTLDAMSHGLPCILSDLRVHSEVSKEGHSALIFRAEDAADLAAKIKEFAILPALRRQYGDRARKTIEEDYVYTAAREKYFRLLRSF